MTQSKAMTAVEAVELAEKALRSANPTKAVGLAILEAHYDGRRDGLEPAMRLLKSVYKAYEDWYDGQPMPVEWAELLDRIHAVVKMSEPKS